MAEKLLRIYKHNLAGLELIPSGGGVFEVKLNERLIFSKKKLSRFPHDGEVEEKIREEL
ncbi:selenoprotein W-related protein [Desulfohalotomaculum tongense]|nr:selenoprotein W-related protein [Desulforadius tongensis]